MSKIFITGDCHGDIDFHKLNSKQFPQSRDLTKNDYVIICGDFGAIWNGGAQDKYLQNWYRDKPWTTLFVDGNHDCHPLIYSYPVVDFFGGKVHKISNKIYHLIRGEIYKIENKTFFTFGGAKSHDKIYRVEGMDWWSQEIPTNEEYNRGLENLEKVNYKVNYIISHEGTDEDLDYLSYHRYEHYKLSNYLQVIKENCNNSGDFIMHYFGHHHRDMPVSIKGYCLYNTIKQIV